MAARLSGGIQDGEAEKAGEVGKRKGKDGMMTPEQYRAACAARQSNPAIGRRKLRKLTGCTDYAADAFLRGKYDGDRERVQAALNPPKPGVSVKDFAGRFDFEAKLRKTLKELCRDSFVSDTDIRAHSGIPACAYRDVAAMPEFQSCQIRDGGTTWWSVKENVDTVRAKAQK